jgi:hypothetical protein
MSAPILTPRWTPLRPVREQQRYARSPHRFNTVPAGRRSGKTEIAKRRIVLAALEASTPWPPRYFAGAPTRDQAKRIFWDDLKALVPPELRRRPSETELCIRLVNGAEIWVVGLDKPERIEGQPWDGGILDEIANMRSRAWDANVRPALSDRLGWCDLIGVPEGRNHYYELDRKARAMMQELGRASEWGAFHWKSSAVLPPSEIEAARRDLDPLTFEQEFNASFVNFQGRAYYPFSEADHAHPLAYDPEQPLALCFDFNVEPGVAAIIQEQQIPGEFLRDEEGLPILDQPLWGTGVIGEVWIERNSNTRAVCRRLAQDWGEHQGTVRCYGDATGGARGSAKVSGSDWDLIRDELEPVFPDLEFHVPPSNPSERRRINAVNTRLRNAAGEIHLKVDPGRAPHVITDFEGVRLLAGGSGEIDKKIDAKLTHLTDAIGYYVEREFPIAEAVSVVPLRRF